MNMRARRERSAWFPVMMLGLLPLLWVSATQGQTTAITSSGLNTHISHTAGQPNYDITGGTRPGNGPNLFHSFAISVSEHRTLRALSMRPTCPPPTYSVVSPGEIPRTFLTRSARPTFSGANLYLINPVGVLFGATATLNVSGSVHISTADYLRLADGLRSNAVPGPQDMLLSQAPVVAFGFLNAYPPLSRRVIC